MSPVFEGMLKMTNDPGTALLVLDRDVDFQDLQNLVEYIYTGNTVVPQDRMNSFLDLGRRFQVAGFASSQPAEQQSSEELNNEEEITATISNNMRDSGFAGTPTRKVIVLQESPEVRPVILEVQAENPEVQAESPAVAKHPVPRMTAAAAVKKTRGRPSKAARERSSSRAREERLFKSPKTSKKASPIKSASLTKSASPTKSASQTKAALPFLCLFCNKTYKSKISLYRHKQSCDANPNLKHYTCPVCNKTMKLTSKYMHNKTHSAEKDGPSTSKRDTV